MTWYKQKKNREFLLNYKLQLSARGGGGNCVRVHTFDFLTIVIAKRAHTHTHDDNNGIGLRINSKGPQVKERIKTIWINFVLEFESHNSINA